MRPLPRRGRGPWPYAEGLSGAHLVRKSKYRSIAHHTPHYIPYVTRITSDKFPHPPAPLSSDSPGRSTTHLAPSAAPNSLMISALSESTHRACNARSSLVLFWLAYSITFAVVNKPFCLRYLSI